MGVARIIAEYGGGEYAVQRIYDEAKLQSLRDRYQSLIDSLTEQIDKLEAEAADLKELSDAKTSEYLAAVDDYAELLRAAIEGGTDRPNKIIYLDKAKAMIEAQGEYQKVKSQIGPLKLSRMSTQKQIDEIESAGDPPIEFAWCADYTEGLTGEVATIEIPGEPQRIVIRPQAIGSPAYDPARDGQLVPREWMRADQVYLAAALLPGWQRWVFPLVPARVDELGAWYITTGQGRVFRVFDGVAVSADTIANVDYEYATSSAAGLSARPPSGPLTNVPATYMTANSEAFMHGDRVIYDKTQGAVIGFQANPRERIHAGRLDWQSGSELVTWNTDSDYPSRYAFLPSSDEAVFLHGSKVGTVPGGLVLGAAIQSGEDERWMIVSTALGFQAPFSTEVEYTGIRFWALPESKWFLSGYGTSSGEDEFQQLGDVQLPTFHHAFGAHVVAFSADGKSYSTVVVRSGREAVENHAAYITRGKVSADDVTVNANSELTSSAWSTKTGTLSETGVPLNDGGFYSIQDETLVSNSTISISLVCAVDYDLATGAEVTAYAENVSTGDFDSGFRSVYVSAENADHSWNGWAPIDSWETSTSTESRTYVIAGNTFSASYVKSTYKRIPYYPETAATDDWIYNVLDVDPSLDWRGAVESAAIAANRNTEFDFSESTTGSDTIHSIVDIRGGPIRDVTSTSFDNYGTGSLAAGQEPNSFSRLIDSEYGIVREWNADIDAAVINSEISEVDLYSHEGRLSIPLGEYPTGHSTESTIGRPVVTGLPPAELVVNDTDLSKEAAESIYGVHSSAVGPNATQVHQFGNSFVKDWNGVIHSTVVGVDSMPTGVVTAK